MKIIKLKNKNEHTREIILHPLIPLKYMINNNSELKIYNFSLFPSIQITRDKYANTDETSVKIIWLMGGIEFIKTKESYDFLYENIDDNRPQCCKDHSKYFSTCDTCEFGDGE